MRKLTILAAGVALMSASAVVAQSSTEPAGQARRVGHTSDPARTAPHSASMHAASSRASGTARETCAQGAGPTTDHAPGGAVAGKSPASPPASGAVDQHGGAGTPCPPQGRF